MICFLAPTFIRLPEASWHGLTLQFASQTHLTTLAWCPHHPSDKASFELHQSHHPTIGSIRSIRSLNPLTAIRSKFAIIMSQHATPSRLPT